MDNETWQPKYYWRGYGWRARLISLADWVESHVLGHRVHAVCCWLAGHSWWPKD